MNITGKRANVEVPGHHSGNVSLCAAIDTGRKVSIIMETLRPHNTEHVLTFVYVITWYNVNFHCAVPIHEACTTNQSFINVFLAASSTFMNPIEHSFAVGEVL